jgi:hypothetical protein
MSRYKHPRVLCPATNIIIIVTYLVPTLIYQETVPTNYLATTTATLTTAVANAAARMVVMDAMDVMAAMAATVYQAQLVLKVPQDPQVPRAIVENEVQPAPKAHKVFKA